MKVWILGSGAVAMATLISSANEFAFISHQTRASANRNAMVETTTSVYDDVFRPETDVVNGADNSHILGFAPKASEASIPDPGINDVTGQAGAEKRKVPSLAEAPYRAGGICTIYRSNEPSTGADNSPDHLHVIASFPTTSKTKFWDLIGTNDSLDAGRTTAAFNAGADDFKLNSSGGSDSGDPLGATDNFAFWQMH
jgi:hypothetical protein